MKYKALNIKLEIPDDYTPKAGDCVSIMFTFLCM